MRKLLSTVMKCTEKCTENTHQSKKIENISKMNHYVT